MNNILTYIILGIIQGITEPLPISSSGHIFLFKNLFNTTMFNSLNFEIISNFGSYDNNNDKHKEFFNNEVQRMVQEVSDRSTQLRNETGINNIILTGEMKPYKPLPTVPPNLSHQLNEAIAERERLKEMKNTIHNSSSDIEVDINSMI